MISEFKLNPPKVSVVRSNVMDLGRAVDEEKLFFKAVKICLAVQYRVLRRRHRSHVREKLFLIHGFAVIDLWHELAF